MPPTTANHSDVNQLPTPALVLDATRIRRNIQKLADYAASVGIIIRPHIKTHKLREIARMQLDAGAGGLAAAKVSEAEALCDPGPDVPPNVYADISALHYRPFQLYHSLMLMQEYGIWNKILFGTDYPFATVNATLDGLDALNGMLDGTELPRLAEKTNPGDDLS